MRSFSTSIAGWKLVIAVLTCAALSGGWLFAWSSQRLGTGSVTTGERPLEQDGTPAAVNGRFAKYFAPKDSPAAERAKSQIEAAGLAVDGASFISAVATRHQPLIDLFRQAGIDQNVRGPGGRTALLTAALDGNWVLFKDFVAAGANPNLADDAGTTPLMAAALANRADVIERLLEKNAEPRALDAQGHTAAHYAMAVKALASLRVLLEHGSGVAGGAGREHDLLAAAYATGDWQFVEPVLSRETPGLHWETAGRQALAGAVAAGELEKARLLLSRYDLRPTPEGSPQPLLAHALVGNNLAQFKLLLDAGADPNVELKSPLEKAFAATIPGENIRYYATTEPGVNVLMLAAGMSRPDYVRLLLEKGAKRGVCTGKLKMYPLYFAAEAQDAPSMQLLIGDCPSPEQMRIEISLASQHATVLQNGVATLNTRISTGRAGFRTPTGNFVITDKHLQHKSTIYKAEMPFFMRLNCRDFGMHEGVVPDYPASHGCIRLPGEVARRLFKEIPIGTLVSIRE